MVTEKVPEPSRASWYSDPEQVLNHPTLLLFSVQAAHLSETAKPPQTRQTHSEAVHIETLLIRDCRAGSGQDLVQESESSGVSSSSCGLPPTPGRSLGLLEALGQDRRGCGGLTPIKHLPQHCVPGCSFPGAPRACAGGWLDRTPRLAEGPVFW